MPGAEAALLVLLSTFFPPEGLVWGENILVLQNLMKIMNIVIVIWTNLHLKSV